MSAAISAAGRSGASERTDRGMAAFGVRRVSWQRRVLFFGSIGAHVAAAIGLILYSIFHVEELAPPEVTLTFFNAPPPPPPPPPPKRSSGSTSKTTTKKTVITTSTIIQPVKPTEEKASAPAEKDDGNKGSDDGVAGGVLGGVAGGVLGGVLGGTGTGTPPPPAAAPPKMVASFTLNGERLSAPPPHLPEEYNNRHPHSTANGSYKMCVGTNGRVSDISVVRPIGGGVDDVIMNQIRNGWTYKPRPLPVCTMQNFVFNIP